MALTTCACRIFASAVMKHHVENRFLLSFLYYVPYVTLAVMTFPAIIQATDYPAAGAAAMIVGIICAWLGGDLFVVAGSCCMTVLILEAIL